MDPQTFIDQHPDMIGFFKIITNSEIIQQQCYHTTELSDISDIAAQHGFSILSSDILIAQALKLLSISEQELQIVASGKKPNTCCQWGRGGQGYLNRPGYWIWHFYDQNTFNMTFLKEHAQCRRINSALDEISYTYELKSFLNCKNFNEVLHLLQDIDKELSLDDIRHYLAYGILNTNNEDRQAIASGCIKEI
jgi:hypothetical protein